MSADYFAAIRRAEEGQASAAAEQGKVGTAELSPFCSADPFRPYLHRPFSAGEYTYATNGHIMVRVPRCADAPEIEKKGHWDKPLEGNGVGEYVPIAKVNLPVTDDPVEGKCPDCDGRSFQHDCPDCECECRACDGKGTAIKDKRASDGISGSVFSLRYIRMFAALPNARFAVPSDSEAPLQFQFDGGIGAIMPLRGTHLTHFELDLSRATGAPQ